MFHQLQKICFIVKGSCRAISATAVIKQPFTPVENPGVHRRLKAIKKHEADVIEKSSIDMESLEEMEENLWDAHHIHNEVISDIKKIQKKHEFKIIERKHFRQPKEPSMLTWAEREQIKFLHQNNPEKWTPEALAGSFPASPTIIRKIINANWKPHSAQRVKEYDEMVSKNWIAFHRGELEVHDPCLRQNLQKFTDRKNGVRIISDEDAKKAAEVILPKPKNTEFLSLITSFKSKNEETASSALEQTKDINHTEEKYKTGPVHPSTTQFTLEELQKKLNTRTVSGAPSEESIMRRDPNVTIQETPRQKDLPYIAPSEGYQPDAYVIQRRKKSHLKLQDANTLPDRIQIPKEKWNRGSIYRVDDSFYDDKGEFLYRVPGFTS